MSRRAARFTQADAARAIRAAQQCGADIVEIKPDGTICVRISPQTTADVRLDDEPFRVEPRRKVVL